MFGVVVEKQVIVLIDTSGSMQASMDELRKELTSLIWEQFHKNQVKCVYCYALLRNPHFC